MDSTGVMATFQWLRYSSWSVVCGIIIKNPPQG